MLTPVLIVSRGEYRLNIPDYIIKNLRTPEPQGFGYSTPSPIQIQAIPILLAVCFDATTLVVGTPVGAQPSYIVM